MKYEDIQFQVFRNPDVKCSVIERAQRTIRDGLYKYFTYKISTYTLTYCRNLFKLTTTQYIPLLA
jgi:hypothetical protein